MADVLIALGGAWNVWQDFAEATAICAAAGIKYDVGAVNEAGRDYAGHLKLWATLHPEKLEDKAPRWARERARKGHNTDYLMASHKQRPNTRLDLVQNEIWSGSSGLFLCQVAAINLKYRRIIVCGMPYTEEGHYHDNDAWRAAVRYRRGWREAMDQPELAGKVRSMSGWTREVLGAPDATWLNQAVPDRP